MNRKFTKSIIALMLVLVLTIASASMTVFATGGGTDPGTGTEDPVTVPATTVVIKQDDADAATASVAVDATITLTAAVTPADTTDTVVWTSSDETKATVANGVVTGKAAGEVTITATAGSVSDTCTVTVTAAQAPATVPATAVAIKQGDADAATASVAVDANITLTAAVTPADTTDTVVWTSSDTTKATVADGVVTGKAAGEVTITATAGSVSDTCTVTVTAAADDDEEEEDDNDFEVLEATVTVEKGKIAEFPKQVTIKLDDNTTVKEDVKWNTADIPADKYSEAGEFTVKGTVTYDGVTKEAVCKVTVVDPKAIVEIKDSKVSTALNTLPKLPTEVTVVLADKTTEKAKVTWESISSDALAKVGTFEVYGAVEGTDEEAKCIVTVGNASTGDDDGDSDENDSTKTGESILGISIAAVLALASFMVMVMCYNIIMKKKGMLVKASANGSAHRRTAGTATRSYVRSGRTPVRRPHSSAYRANRRR